MNKPEPRASADTVALSCRIVSAYVLGNAVPVDRVPALIADVHATLVGRRQAAPEPAAPWSPSLAQIRASLGPGGIFSFKTGKRYTSLRRHLGSLGLSPDAYRRKWGLPSDYPMVAANFAAQRSELAKASASAGCGSSGPPDDTQAVAGLPGQLRPLPVRPPRGNPARTREGGGVA
ncbi:MucR family transcriptional regulator [Methylobacterium oryzisoli]|uniref:MucR family transcriptional regulator n=1 Tax=Methylobacterium oryzisoli TaxID=3385502 RepID=UPI0038919D8B